jgi:hypothetical protein
MLRVVHDALVIGGPLLPVDHDTRIDAQRVGWVVLGPRGDTGDMVLVA